MRKTLIFITIYIINIAEKKLTTNHRMSFIICEDIRNAILSVIENMCFFVIVTEITVCRFSNVQLLVTSIRKFDLTHRSFIIFYLPSGLSTTDEDFKSNPFV